MAHDPASPTASSSSPPPEWSERIGKVRHDLRNPLSDILGFTELLADEARERNLGALAGGLESIRQAANRMLADVNHALSPKTSFLNTDGLENLKLSIRQQVDEILVSAGALAAQCDALPDALLGEDARRVIGSARHLREFAPAALDGLIELGSAIRRGRQAGEQPSGLDGR